MTLKEKLSNNLILRQNNILIKNATISELMYIWSKNSLEKKEYVTCRPVIQRDFEFAQKNFLKNMENPNILFLIITLSNEPIGRISFSDYNPRNRSLELGYSLLPKFRKQGYMLHSLKILISYVFRNTDINKIYAQTGSFNEDSIKLLKKLGFAQDACLREHHELNGLLYSDFIYSLLASDYHNNKIYCSH